MLTLTVNWLGTDIKGLFCIRNNRSYLRVIEFGVKVPLFCHFCSALFAQKFFCKLLFFWLMRMHSWNPLPVLGIADAAFKDIKPFGPINQSLINFKVYPNGKGIVDVDMRRRCENLKGWSEHISIHDTMELCRYGKLSLTPVWLIHGKQGVVDPY